MTINGKLEVTANVTQTLAVDGVSYNGTPAISVAKQVKGPTYEKAHYDAATIAAPSTLNVYGTHATPSGTITFGSPSNGDTVVVTGPTGGPFTFTKAASPGANAFSAIAELTALINAITGLDATDNGTAITLAVTVAGTSPNSWTVTGTGSYSGLSITFSGGAASDLTDPFGSNVAFATVKGLVIKNTSSTASLTVGGGSSALVGALPAITPGGSITLDLSITTSNTVKNLLLTPSASLAYELLIFGT